MKKKFLYTMALSMALGITCLGSVKMNVEAYGTGNLPGNPDIFEENDPTDGAFDVKEDANLYQGGQDSLEEILNRADGVDERYDINKNGIATVEDLYLGLVRNDIVGGSSKDVEGVSMSPCPLELQITKGEKGATVDIYWSSNGFSKEYLDYAINYDNSKIQVENIQWSGEFLNVFGQHIENAMSYYVQKDMGNYVMLAGCFIPMTSHEIRKIATITFSYITDEKESGPITMTVSQSKYKNDKTLIEENADKIIRGDFDGDGLELEDAKSMLRYALLLDEYYGGEDYYMDMNGDGQFTLTDAQKILRQALLLEPQQEEVLDYNRL